MFRETVGSASGEACDGLGEERKSTDTLNLREETSRRGGERKEGIKGDRIWGGKVFFGKGGKRKLEEGCGFRARRKKVGDCKKGARLTSKKDGGRGSGSSNGERRFARGNWPGSGARLGGRGEVSKKKRHKFACGRRKFFPRKEDEMPEKRRRGLGPGIGKRSGRLASGRAASGRKNAFKGKGGPALMAYGLDLEHVERAFTVLTWAGGGERKEKEGKEPLAPEGEG